MTNELNGRQIVYTNQVPFDTHVLNTNRYKMADVGWLGETILGYPIGNTPLVSRLACAPISPPGLQVTVGPGTLYQFEAYDATPYGSLPADTDPNHYLYKQYINWDPLILNTPAPINPGNSVIHLVEVIFNTSDVNIISNPYFNSSAPPPAPPIFLSMPDCRIDQITINLKQGVEAPSPVPPTPDAGYTALYYITVTYGQTSIISGNISVVPGAPFITEGLTQKISQATGNGLYQPLVNKYSQVRFNTNATQNISSFPGKVLLNGTASGPNASWWNSGTHRMIPTISGLYEFNMRLQFDSPPIDNMILYLYKNGVLVDYIAENYGDGTENIILNGISTPQSSNGVSDYFEMYINTDFVGTLVVGDIGGTGLSTLFQAKYIGQ